MHALRVARKLRIPRVVFPIAAGVMSAVGLLASPLAFEVTRTAEARLEDLRAKDFSDRFASLAELARAPLLEAGLSLAQISVSLRLDMRYAGQGHEIEVALPLSLLDEASNTGDDAALRRAIGLAFRERYESLYAFTDLSAPLALSNWKVGAEGPEPLQPVQATTGAADDETPEPTRFQAVQFGSDATERTPVYSRYALKAGHQVNGPALIEERESTIVLGPEDRAFVDGFANIVAELDA